MNISGLPESTGFDTPMEGILSHSAIGNAEVVRSIPIARERAARNRRPLAAEIEKRWETQRFHRVMNITLALLLLVLTAPIMLLFAVLVKLTSRGPIMYSQARVGLDRRRSTRSGTAYDRRARNLGGKPFMIFKFRTMYMDAEKHGAVWAAKGDDRVTAVGRVMRTYRIDELPQLVNVLRGDMDIVGPRPERPSIFSRLCDDIVDYPLRQQAKPGITGWAQVNQSYDTNLDDVRRKVRYDLEYLQRKSVAEDLLIMARTLPVMIFRRGGW